MLALWLDTHWNFSVVQMKISNYASWTLPGALNEREKDVCVLNAPVWSSCAVLLFLWQQAVGQISQCTISNPFWLALLLSLWLRQHICHLSCCFMSCCHTDPKQSCDSNLFSFPGRTIPTFCQSNQHLNRHTAGTLWCLYSDAPGFQFTLMLTHLRQY